MATSQFGSKIHAHNSEKVGAEFWSACCKLSHMPQVPSRQGSGTPRHYVRRAGQATIGAHVPDELTGSKCHSRVTAENCLEVPSYDDDGLGYVLTFFENNLPRRAVDPPGKADELQEFSFVDRAECDAVELVFPVTENYRPLLQS
jgi:hypothetical protein